MTNKYKSKIKHLLEKYPRFIFVNVNSDEEVGLYVIGLALLESGNFRVAGRIEREDSKAIQRGHNVHVKKFMDTSYNWRVLSYDEYDDNDGGQIHTEIILETPKQILSKATF
jgi:hypothetical protein